MKDEKKYSRNEICVRYSLEIVFYGNSTDKTILEISQVKFHLFLFLQKWREYYNDISYAHHPYSIMINILLFLLHFVLSLHSLCHSFFSFFSFSPFLPIIHFLSLYFIFKADIILTCKFKAHSTKK